MTFNLSSANAFSLDKAKILSFGEELNSRPGSVLTEQSLSFSPMFANWNETQLLVGLTVWFSQSEVVLHSEVFLNIEKSGE